MARGGNNITADHSYKVPLQRAPYSIRKARGTILARLARPWERSAAFHRLIAWKPACITYFHALRPCRIIAVLLVQILSNSERTKHTSVDYLTPVCDYRGVTTNATKPAWPAGDTPVNPPEWRKHMVDYAREMAEPSYLRGKTTLLKAGKMLRRKPRLEFINGYSFNSPPMHFGFELQCIAEQYRLLPIQGVVPQIKLATNQAQDRLFPCFFHAPWTHSNVLNLARASVRHSQGEPCRPNSGGGFPNNC